MGGSKFTGDISKGDVGDVGEVKNMESMFKDSQFDGDISKWDVGSRTKVICMFKNTKFGSFNTVEKYTKAWKSHRNLGKLAKLLKL